MPHSLRRTYISIALLANNFDVQWVMSQVGHAESKMTLDVYAQLEQRIQRSHGTEFDRLVRHACEQLHGTSTGAPAEGVFWPRNGPGGLARRPRTMKLRGRKEKNPAICRALRKWRDPDSNRGHHDFQSCALPAELSRPGAQG